MEQEVFESLEVNDFDLDLTLSSGQFFRYSPTQRGYALRTQGKDIIVEKHGKTLFFAGCHAGFIQRLLGLDDRHHASVRELQEDEKIAHIVEDYKSLRIMEMDLHETIIAFILSSNSNIKKNQLSHKKLEELHGWPVPGEHLCEDMLRSCSMGYRAKYISASNKMLSKNFLDELKRLDYQGSHEMLLKLPGVGPKVADCICLFSLGHSESFPVDVHIHRAMRRIFSDQNFKTPRHAKEFAMHRWGPNAGLAQQFIFQWARDTA